jgi:hypothetical protein
VELDEQIGTMLAQSPLGSPDHLVLITFGIDSKKLCNRKSGSDRIIETPDLDLT